MEEIEIKFAVKDTKAATEVDENHGPSTNGSWMRCDGCRATVFCTLTRWLTTAWRMERGFRSIVAALDVSIVGAAGAGSDAGE